MTALRSRNFICLQGAVMVSLGRMEMCADAHTPVPGVKLEGSVPDFAFRIVAFALSSPVSSL